jgi:PHD/YefM family antitoxin component YafN of YafNO toxin-antitoxin module
MFITANEVKKRGVSIFDEMLKKFDELVINVRGKNKFVVVNIERYNRLREAELELAYQELLKDYKEGEYKVLSAKEHIENLKKELDV